MRKLVVVALLCTLPLTGCAEDEEPEAEGTVSLEVEASDFRFDPTTVLVDIGSPVEITLDNVGSVAHSFTVPDLDLEVEAEGGESVTISFTAPAEPAAFDFFCKFHPNDMTGTLSVGGEPDEVPAGDEDEDVEEDDEEDVDVDVETEDDDADTEAGAGAVEDY